MNKRIVYKNDEGGVSIINPIQEQQALIKNLTARLTALEGH